MATREEVAELGLHGSRGLEKGSKEKWVLEIEVGRSCGFSGLEDRLCIPLVLKSPVLRLAIPV